jgi:hypothetical protein
MALTRELYQHRKNIVAVSDQIDVSGAVNVTTQCPDCKNGYILTVDMDRFEKWLRGIFFVQDAFPTLNANDRERLITGFCPKCWDKMARGF